MDRRTLGKYELLCRLSTGGMSEIFLAHQKGLAGFKKVVVLKSILPDIRGEEDFVKMFLDEARITAAFNHPNVAQVFDLDTAEGMLFLAMEFVQGCTLVEMARACRQAREPIPIGFTLSSVRDTALALHYAHNFTDARGRRQVVIHRDVAEKNIMVNYDGVTKLLDFGIAKAMGKRTAAMTSIGMVKGTSGYMSPEQIRGEPLDQRSDIFSLGVVLHECLTGMRLFHGKSPEEGMLAALREDAPKPSRQNPLVSPALDAVTLKALARDREARFKTALEFAREIERVCPGELWHPEQSGELVQRHFVDRRAQTRDLIEDGQEPHDLSGELHLGKVMAAVGHGRASSEKDPTRDLGPRIDMALEPRRGPPPPPVEEETVRKVVAGPAVTPGLPQRRDSKPTVPAQGGRVVTEPNAAIPERTTTGDTNTGSIDLTPNSSFYDDDDDVGAKTIPAAALPDELLKLQRAKATTRPQKATPATPPPKPPPPVPSRPGPGKSITSETQSLPPHADFSLEDDDDVGVKTTLSRPFEVLKEPPAPLRAEDLFDETPGQPMSVQLDIVTGDHSGHQALPEAASTYDGGASLDDNDEGDERGGEDDVPITSAHRLGKSKVIIFASAGALVVALGIASFALKPFAKKADEAPPKVIPVVVVKPKEKEPEKEKAKPPPPEPPTPHFVEPPPPEPPKVAVVNPPPVKPPKKIVDRRPKKPKAEDGEEPPAKEVVMADVSLVVDQPVTVMWNGKELGNTPLKTKLPVGKQQLRLLSTAGGPSKSIIVDVRENGTALRYDWGDL